MIRRLEASFLGLDGPEMALRLHRRLLARDPSLHSSPPEWLKGQEGMLLATLRTVIGQLRSPPQVRMHLEELRQEYARLGINPGLRQALTLSLVDTIAEMIGPAWDAELECHWRATARLVSEAMTD